MNLLDKPVHDAVIHDYPFFLASCFSPQNGDFRLERLEYLIHDFIVSSLKDQLAKKPDEAEKLLVSVATGFACIRGSGTGYAILGEEGNFETCLHRGDKVRIEIIQPKVFLELKRYGRGLCIKALSREGHEHVLATSLLKTFAEQDKLLSYLIDKHVIHVPFHSGRTWNNLDLFEELTSAELYVPDVQWHITDVGKIVDLLKESYIETGSKRGVEVGRYHGIPIYLHVYYGEGKEENWRKGAVSRKMSLLRFSGNSTDIFQSLQYVVGISYKDEYGSFDTDTISDVEQSCLKQIADILLPALTARHLARSIRNNPSLVKWKDPSMIMIAEKA